MFEHRRLAIFTIVSLTGVVLLLTASNVLLWINNQENTNTFGEALRTENARLEQIEKSLSALEISVDGMLGKINLMPGAGEGVSSIEDRTELLRQLVTQGRRDIPEFKISAQTVTRLTDLIRRLEVMDREGSARSGPRAPISVPVPPPIFDLPKSAKPPAGRSQMPERFSGLTKEKRAYVEQVFLENAELIRREMSVEPDPRQVSPERLREIMEDSQDFLIDKLSDVLNDEELDAFIQEFPIRKQ